VIEIVLALLLGLLAGSFLNVCIHRLPRDLSVVRPRSYCPACEAPIAWYDNIPLLSYALLLGKCRRCGTRIPVRYPLVELATAAVFVFSVARLGVSLPALKWSLFGALMIGLLFSDLEQRILPDEFTLGGALAGLLLALWTPMPYGFVQFFVQVFAAGAWPARWISLGEAVLGAAVGSGLLWVVGRLYLAVRHREGLGLGDVKMLAAVGAFLGLQGALQTLVLGSIAGSIVGLIYIKATRKSMATYELPFGTFLALAALAVGMLYGPLQAWPG